MRLTWIFLIVCIFVWFEFKKKQLPEWNLNKVQSSDTEFPFSALPTNDRKTIKRALKEFLMPEDRHRITAMLDKFSRSSNIDENMDVYKTFVAIALESKSKTTEEAWIKLMNGVRPFLEKDKPKFKIDKNYNVRSIEEIIRKRVDFLNAEQIIFIIECLFRSDVIEERREICFRILKIHVIAGLSKKTATEVKDWIVADFDSQRSRDSSGKMHFNFVRMRDA